MKKKLYVGIMLTALCINLPGCSQIDGKSVDMSEGKPAAELSVSEEPETTETPQIITQKITPKKKYSDSYRTVEFLGFKEYKKIKGKSYTDTPKKGYRYLVLFLSVRNESTEDDYINYNCISAKVDGKTLEHTYLLNDPENYPTLLTTVKAKDSIGGFVVWEVPKDWEKFEFSYTGWENINQIDLKAVFSKKNLKNPPKYDSLGY